ncbi:unnamed protein product [Linum tenue]|uniref:RING-type domain-containing protein n=1 Tax=Linum tenue TaxID=586396 RepID=A0AAV0HV54_9ROSI|nr:unnamed protein product [Linum tenue]
MISSLHPFLFWLLPVYSRQGVPHNSLDKRNRRSRNEQLLCEIRTLFVARVYSIYIGRNMLIHIVNVNDAGDMPFSSGRGSLPHEDSAELKPPSLGMQAQENSTRLLNLHSSLSQQHYNLGRSISLKRSRHHYGHHYSRRNTGSHAGPSLPSHGRNHHLSHDERLPFKFGSQHEASLQFRHQGGEVNLTTEFTFSLLYSIKMVCGICQKLLRRKPYSLGDLPSSSGEYAVVAVLVCGHMYHAECLEENTSLENTSDPQCPQCCV